MNGGMREVAGTTTGRNILVTTDIDDRALEPAADTEQTDRHTIVVVPDHGVRDWLDEHDTRTGHPEPTIVSVGGHNGPNSDDESADGTATGPETEGTTDSGVRSVESTPVTAIPASELAALCEAVHDGLDAADGAPIDLRVDALDDILHAVPLRSAFVLLVTLTAMVDNYDAHAIYHLDPDAHDDHTLHTLEPLFDEHVA